MVWNFKPKGTKSGDGKPFRTWEAQPVTKLALREDGQLMFSEAKALSEALRDKKTVIDDVEDTVADSNQTTEVPF